MQFSQFQELDDPFVSNINITPLGNKKKKCIKIFFSQQTFRNLSNKKYKFFCILIFPPI